MDSILIAGLAVAAFLSYKLLSKSSDNALLPLPPGPPRDPVIGSARYFPTERIGENLYKWQKQYGNLVCATLPTSAMILVYSNDIAQELLSKRPNTTSNRSIGYYITDMMGWKWSPAFAQPNPHYANQRKMLRRGIGPQRIATHNLVIERQTNALLLKLSTFQGYVPPVIMNAMGHLVIEVTYGTEIEHHLGNQLSTLNQEAMEIILKAFYKLHLVDVFHFLRFIPSWMPGAGFKRIAQRSQWLSNYLRYETFAKVKELYNAGKLGPSLATDLLDEFGTDDSDVMDALAVLYIAGSDTTTAAIVAFLHALYLFPTVATKVYDEIKAVTLDGQRLLTVPDRQHLPYTEAVWKESMRWNPFILMGVPHVNIQDEYIQGYRIPKGSMILQHTGFMLTDPTIWRDPDVFRPERFLTDENASELPNPLGIIFGYGMRICPGMYLADRAGFHIAASVTSVYRILPREENVVPSVDNLEYTDSPFRLPTNFDCRFIPHDKQAQDLVKSISLQQ